LIVTSLSALAAGTDELWEITTKMEMAGMPMMMPAQTNQVCKPKNRPADEELVPKDKNSDCKMDDMQHSGNKTTFKMSCSGKHAMTGNGEFEKSGDNYRGSMHMQGNMEGRSIDMTQSFSGKLIGSCTYEDLGKKFAAQQENATAEMCRKGISDLEWRMFAAGPMQEQFAACKPFKKEFCARVDKVAADLHTPKGFHEFADKHSDWKDLLDSCGIDKQVVLADLCKKSVDAQDWSIVASNCPAEAKTLAAEHCAGRDYTALMLGPYAPLCRGIGREPATNVQQATSKEDAIKNGVNEGVNKLKKLLPF
jgi:hypothetical protein